MGGMAFHLMWETKSQYVFQYIVCFIPVAAMLLGEFDGAESRKATQKEKEMLWDCDIGHNLFFD